MNSKLKLQHIINDRQLIGKIYRNLRLHHDAVFTKVKTKKEIKRYIDNNKCRLVIATNDDLMDFLHLYSSPNQYSRKIIWNLRRYSSKYNKINFTEHRGGITRLIGYLLTDNYYVYDQANNNGKSYYVERRFNGHENVDVDEFIEEICRRVYPLARRALNGRFNSLHEKLMDFINPDGDFDLGPEMNHYGHYYNQDNFLQIARDFEKTVSLRNDEEFRKHLTLTIRSFMIIYFGRWGTKSSDITVHCNTNPWNSSWDDGHSYRYNNHRQDVESVFNLHLKRRPESRRLIINDIAKQIIWFYRNLVHEERKVRYWDPLTIPEEFV